MVVTPFLQARLARAAPESGVLCFCFRVQSRRVTQLRFEGVALPVSSGGFMAVFERPFSVYQSIPSADEFEPRRFFKADCCALHASSLHGF